MVNFRNQRRLFLGPVHTYPGYFLIRNFFFPGIASNSAVHTHPAISTANPDIFRSALQSEQKNKSSMNPITCGRVNPDIFESDDEVNSCPVSYRTINKYGVPTATTGLYGVCFEHTLLQRSPGYLSDSGYHRMRVDRRIRFEYATYG